MNFVIYVRFEAYDEPFVYVHMLNHKVSPRDEKPGFESNVFVIRDSRMNTRGTKPEPRATSHALAGVAENVADDGDLLPPLGRIRSLAKSLTDSVRISSTRCCHGPVKSSITDPE